jgi:hypothetical protein
MRMMGKETTMKSKKVLVVLIVLVLGLLALSSASASATGCPPGCTRTPGFWKNHPEAWPVEMITVGGVTYTKDAAIAIIKTPERGDKTYTLFRAFVAARLNQFVGADTSCPIPPRWTVQDLIWQADDWLMYHPPGDGVRGSSDAWQGLGEWKYEWLDAYNNGDLCVPECD